MKILPDTCTFLWASQQPAMLSQVAIAVIDDSRSELHVSDVSLWEITLKHAAGKLPLPDAPPRLDSAKARVPPIPIPQTQPRHDFSQRNPPREAS